jgi:competence protein ComEA
VKHFFREYFTFNKRERNGILALLLIILIEIIYLNIAHLFYTPKSVDFSAFDDEMKALEFQSHSKKYSVKKTSFSKTLSLQPIAYFKFNPNKLSDEEWTRLGLSDKQIQVIKNYQKKGGKFYTKSDFKKMYCISEKQYLQLQDYIVIPDSKDKSDEKVLLPVSQETKQIIVEINAADSLQLISINGIGSYYAKSIIQYRSRLGGFYSKQQLLEVNKFTEEKLSQIHQYITVDTMLIHKININTCSSKQLKHPYLNWNQVNGIINYRNKHGNYKFVEDIRNTELIDDTTYSKIKYYLTVQ